MPKLEKLTNEDGSHITYWFYCPGCKRGHGFDSRWTFNGDIENPTFSPSLLVNGSDSATRCHSFVTDGKIQFLDDCWHELKGKIVDLPDTDLNEI